MKLTFLFFVLGLLQVSASVYSQSTKLTLEMSNRTVVEVLDEIEKQSEFRFAYSSELINMNRKVTVNLNRKNIEETLDVVFKGTGVTYVLHDRHIMLYPKEIEASSKSQTESGQQKSVSGKVTDEKGEPLPGVSVIIEGTINGTVTDFDGNFRLTNLNQDVVLVFSFVGMITEKVKVGDQTELSITMQADAIGIEEVIAVGYGIQKKVNLTGAISNVKTEELTTISASNMSNVLAGRASGVQIAGTSGLAGASSRIRLRGSFKEPLYVIDGIIRDKGAFDALEVTEVKEISFLKDAATASIYGSRAGNGVVLVKTKDGKKQKPTLNYQGSYSASEPTQTLLSDMFTATDELIYQNRVAEYRGLEAPNGEEEFAYFENRDYNVNDIIWRNPSSHKHSLSVNGGSDKISYFAIASYRGEKGSYIGTDYNKVNLRSNVTAHITDDLTFGLNLAANQRNGSRFYWPYGEDEDETVADMYRATFNWPRTYPFYLNADGTPSDEVTDYPVSTPMGSWLGWSPVDMVIGDRYVKQKRREFSGRLEMNYDLGKLVKGLSTKVVGYYMGYDSMKKRYLTFQKNYIIQQADPDGNRFVLGPPDVDKFKMFTFKAKQESLDYTVATSWRYQFNWFLNYQRTFNDIHDVSAMVVFEQAENGRTQVYAKGEEPLTSYDQMYVYSEDSERRYGDAYERVGSLQSWIGRVNYAYKGKYLMDFSFRYDGNNKFPENGRWGFFPSVSAGWRMSEENFMENLGWLDNLKLRASYGTTGNDLNVNNKTIGNFDYMFKYQDAGSYIFGDNLQKTLKPGVVPNIYLTWATSTNYNTGLDFTVLDGRLSSVIDVFYRKETDILGSRLVTLPDTYGRDLAPENYAERSWRGGEIELNWRDEIGSTGIKYGVHANLGYARDQWDVYDEDESYAEGGINHWRTKIGKPANTIYGLRSLGLIRTQEQLDELLDVGFKSYGRDPYLGGILFEDIRGDGYSEGPDGKIDSNDQQLLTKNPSPRVSYGFGFDLEWKGWALDAHFQGVGQYDRILAVKGTPDNPAEGIPQYGGSIRPYYPVWAGDVWTPENPDGKYPRVIGQRWYESGTGTTDFWLRNGAYLRLKNVNLSYKIPQTFTQQIGLVDVKLFFNGTNLFAISDIKEFHDPEQQEYGGYPLMRTFTFGIDVKF
uniref:TonB-dependent receptor n=1 Tax=uncultured Draconibacterium sp. TaxID=1573823 RepID=UPI0032178AD9